MANVRKTKHTRPRIATGLTAAQCTHTFLVYQKSARYDDLQIVQEGKLFAIVGCRTKLERSPRGQRRIKRATFVWYGKERTGKVERTTNTMFEISFVHSGKRRKVWRSQDCVTIESAKKKSRVYKKGSKVANPANGELVSAVELSTAFHGFKPRSIRHININFPKALMQLGDCAQVDYLSDKDDGKLRHYYHRFEKPCLVFASARPQKDGDNLLVIKGQFEITERGIIG